MENPEKQSSILKNVARAFKVIFSHPVLFVGLAVLVAVPSELLQKLISEFLMRQTSDWLPAHGMVIDPQKGGIIVLTLTDLLILPWICVVGAFVLPAALRIFIRDQEGESVDFNDTVNFGLSRWSRVIKPYTLTTIIVAVGFIVVVPGVLYTLYFAFVLAIATLDDRVKQPLVRSRKLVRGRLGRIFRTYCVFIPWWGWYRTLGELVLQDVNPYLRTLLSVVDVLVTFAIELSLLQLYFERMDQLKAALEKRQAEGALPAGEGAEAT